MDTEKLRSLVNYDSKTGVLTRKNGRILSGVNAGGYVQTVVCGEFFYGHRLAWQIYYGEEAYCEIDHINGVRNDNRISNLRLASRGQNQKNSRTRCDNTSGIKGVSWYGKRKVWVATINADGETKLYKHFKNIEDAISAVRDARIKCHGDYLNHGDQ